MELPVHKIEKALAIEVYASKESGIGGVIRDAVEDFVVDEVLVDRSIAKIENAENKALRASLDKQEFLLCVLRKKNWDTFIAIKNIARQLGISQDQINIAGIKDTKAITSQHITIQHATFQHITKIAIKDIEVAPIGYYHQRLSPYYLLGNNFRITIKAISFSEFSIAKRIEKIMKEIEVSGGLPNFFGHQRFGTTRSITHRVGKAIIQGKLESAIMIFLAEASVHEHPVSRKARQELRSTQDFKKALHNFPKQLRYERLILAHLAANPGDFVGAFRRLPRKLQFLFVQAYQSYLFNRFLSKRIQMGLKLNLAEVGDYVVNVERTGLPLNIRGRIVDFATLPKINNDLGTGRLRLALPLIGFKQRPSGGVMGQMEKQVLLAEGIKMEDFKLNVLPELSGRGGLRPITSPIINFRIRDISRDLNDQESIQVTLEFMLLRGSYATILLREIIKPKDPIVAGF